MEFCKSRGATCTMNYAGSLDIALGLKPGAALDADAVWPAASIWVDLYDTGRRVTSLKSIAQMPVILGVRRSKAEDLGWIGKPVATKDILAAVESGKLKFLMTSATQSNSGASAYLAMLAAALGKDLIEPADLDRDDVRNTVRGLLRGVERSAGSSGWLADLYMAGEDKNQHFDAMWNYEAVIKETNDTLRAKGREQLYAIYPEDGVFVADSPLGYVDRGRGKEVTNFFNDLRSYLLSADVQAKIAATGRRVELAATAASVTDPATNLDPGRKITVVRPPEPSVIAKALVLYQEALRRPSLTAMCLDLSGSMGGNGGQEQLLEAMKFVLSPAKARELLVQWSHDDTIIVMPFDSDVRWTAKISGSEDEQSTLLQKALQLRAGGGTDFYTCAARALAEMKPELDKGDDLPAIVIMTDGQSQGSIAEFGAAWEADGRRVPVFGITFGNDADRSQLDTLANLTGGRVFDGTKSLTEAFRAVRGYN
jgi:Ca-activated chloride channel family protein